MITKKLFLLPIALLLASPLLPAQSLNGRWSATVNVRGVEIPFRIDFAGDGPHASGWLFNGKEKIPSTSGEFTNGSLKLSFDGYATELDATLHDGVLEGQYVRGSHGSLPFRAVRYVPEKLGPGSVPRIDGRWELQTHTRYGEASLLLLIHQSGPHVTAAISRVDGDTGALDGSYKDGKFTLGHFDGARPLLLEITPIEGGSLAIVESTQKGQEKLVAWRPEVARSKGFAPPVDPAQHTHLQNPDEPLRFSFPDLNGHIVTNEDPRFRNKVVLVTISGSWCPNCHDEAPFLEALYRKYHSRGLEVVAFSFEEADQLKNPTRLRAFIKQYGIDYTVLLAGEPDQIAAKVPQAVNLDAVPSTFFLDRHGRVQSIHAGFAGPATGEVYTQLQEETNEKVEHLLAEEKEPAKSPSPTSTPAGHNGK
jgi:peroxiredoxin